MPPHKSLPKQKHPTPWHEQQPNDAFQYPYRRPANYAPSLPDPFKRNKNLLLASLSHFCHLILDGLLVISNTTLADIMRTITRLCEDTSLPGDFDILMQNFPPDDILSRSFYELSVLENDPDPILSVLEEINLHDQVIFFRRHDNGLIAIYLIMLPWHTIEIYTVGAIDLEKINKDASIISEFINILLPDVAVRYRLRLQVPSNLPVNKSFMAYILVKELHHQGSYLDLTIDKVCHHKLSILGELIECHDKWLGRIPTACITTQPFPFVITNPKNVVPDTLKDLVDSGWHLVHVTADGNCGFYCLILGLENLGRTDYSIRQSSTFSISMERNVPWQFNIMRLRRSLQNRSRDLLSSEYAPGQRDAEWFRYTSATNSREYDELSDRFCDNTLRQHTYFDGTLLEPEYKQYHMNPYWGAHVFACLFQTRVILYTRTSEWDGVKVTYSWSTTTTSPWFPPNERIRMVTGINKISDMEYNRSRTIEILYTTGMIGNRQHEENRFHFLRRVICDNIKQTSLPPSTTLNEFLQGKDGTVETSDEVPTPPVGTNVEGTPIADSDLFAESDMEEAAETSPVRTDIEKEPSVDSDLGPIADSDLFAESDAEDAAETPPVGPDIQKKPSVNSDLGPVPQERGCQQTAVGKKRYTKRAKKEIAKKKRRYTILFNNLLEDGTLKHKTATQMFYNPFTMRYFVRNMDESGKFQPKRYVEHVDEYDERLVQAAKQLPDVWVGPTPGDAFTDLPPTHLSTKVATIHQQHGNPFCLVYSLASALFYCGFDWQAEALIQKAGKISTMDFEGGISEVREFMKELVPLIGLPMIFGKRLNSKGRTKRNIEWKDVLDNYTPFPTVVIPLLPDGSTSHAFCIVDDLIFDSSTQFALKLQWESVQWICNYSPCRIYQMLRFQHKFTAEGVKRQKKDKYVRPVKFNWNHPPPTEG